jgi:hypothetical protein
MKNVTVIDTAPRAPRSARPRFRNISVEASVPSLLAALGQGDTPLGAVLRQTGELSGMPSVVFWKPDGRRLQLAYRHGDDLHPPEGNGMRLLGGSDQDDVGTQGIPLMITASAAAQAHVMTINGSWFAAIGAGGGLLALGPFGERELGRRDRRELIALAALCDAPLRQALRIGELTDQVRALTREADLHRRSLGSATDEVTSLGLLLELAVSTSGSIGGFVAVRDGDALRIAAERSAPVGFAALDLTPGHGVLSAVPGVPGVLFVDGYEALLDLGIGGLVAVGGPQDAADPQIVMGLFSDTDGVLEPDCAPMLSTLVDVAAIVMTSAEVARGTAARHLAALEALCRALDARTHATKHHHARVAQTAAAIAVGLGLPAERVALVTQAARIHDVGLIAATSDAAIAAEFAHPAVGADMAALVPGAAELAPIIRAHHEWWDGFGFPNGLLGEAIPVEARVLAAAEFSVETRQADPSLDAAALVGEIQSRSGGHLDPACAQQLIDIIQEP